MILGISFNLFKFQGGHDLKSHVQPNKDKKQANVNKLSLKIPDINPKIPTVCFVTLNLNSN